LAERLLAPLDDWRVLDGRADLRLESNDIKVSHKPFESFFFLKKIAAFNPNHCIP
jgi:hypothetical protein